ncbi:hypothetical protein ACFL7M_03515 [Thermodesulfobacteriota bacterium]
MSKRLIALLVVCSVLLVLPGVGVCQDKKPISIRYGNSFASSHPFSMADDLIGGCPNK